MHDGSLRHHALSAFDHPGEISDARRLTVRNLTFTAKGKNLLTGLDLRLGSSGMTVVMGPNGAGKSILLRLLHGLIPASEGSIAWGGQPVSGATRARQALVFQSPVLLRRTVAANIDFVLSARGTRSRSRRDALLDHVGLWDCARQPARLLSGGEQQRLALARALATDPEVLFLDEPTASLDPASVLRIEEIVKDAEARGTRIFFVTHDISQARRLAHDVLFLHRGRLVEHAPANLFFSQPESPVAQDFLEGRIVV